MTASSNLIKDLRGETIHPYKKHMRPGPYLYVSLTSSLWLRHAYGWFSGLLQLQKASFPETIPTRAH